MTKEVLKPISLSEIKTKAKGFIIEIPDWEEGKTIAVRIRSIDVTPQLLSSGMIPDRLSSEVVTLFEGENAKNNEPKEDKKQDISLETDKMMPLIDSIVKQALVEPTFDEIQEIYPLNLNQKMAIFMAVTGGIDKLKPFRAK